MTDPAPSFPDKSVGETIRSLLASSGYREGPLHELLEVPVGGSLLGAGLPVLRRRITRASPELRVLLELFLMSSHVSREEGEAAVGARAVDALLACGLVNGQDGDLRGTVHLSAIEDLVIASDLSNRHRSREADFVLGPGGVTRRLAELAVRRPVASVLDLGCGAGVLAGLAAAHARRVVATDINARAVDFTRFNARLNGLEHMEARVGSLFEPVAEERFDLVLCNPPYVISPTSTFIYRDGGTELCRQIVAEAPDHLTPSGMLQMMAEWPQRESEPWQDEVARWFAGSPCHAWVLRLYTFDAPTYANMWLRQLHTEGSIPEEAFSEWMAHLSGLNIDSVGGGLVILQPANGEEPRRVFRDAPPVAPGPCGVSVAGWVASQRLLARLPDPASILDTTLVPSPELERRDERRPTGTGWTAAKPRLRLRSGLRFGARVDPVAAEIVGLLDGRRTPREALSHFAEAQGVSVAPFVAGLPGALLRLLELGLLIPAEEADEIRSTTGSGSSGCT